MSNYRSYKEIEVREAEWGECERQITPVENVALFHVEHASGKGLQAALFHVEQFHHPTRRWPMARIICSELGRRTGSIHWSSWASFS